MHTAVGSYSISKGGRNKFARIAYKIDMGEAVLTVVRVGTVQVIKFALIIVEYLLAEVGRSVGIAASYRGVETCSEPGLLEGGLDRGHPWQLCTFTF